MKLLWTLVILIIPSVVLGQTADELRTAIDKAVAEEKYEDALAFLKELDRLGVRLKSQTLRIEAKERTKAVEELRDAAKAAREAELKLSAGPDPEASLVAGRFQAFVRGNWEVGLKLLLAGSDPKLKTLAALDLNKVEKVKVAEGWLAEIKRYPLGRKQLEDRAADLLRQAWNESSDIEREKLRFKLKTIAGVPERLSKGPMFAAEWSFRPGTSIEDGFAKKGRRSLRLVPVKDNWAGVESEKTQPHKEYEISALVFTNGSDGKVEVCVRYWANDGKYLGQEGPAFFGDLPIWSAISRTVRPGPNVSTVDFLVSFVGNTGTVWVDEVSIKAEGKELLSNGSFER